MPMQFWIWFFEMVEMIIFTICGVWIPLEMLLDLLGWS
jgi:hypothetical protein